MIYSVIDIGSNTVKCAVYNVENNDIRQINFYSRQLGLIAKIVNGNLTETAINQLTETINLYISKYNSIPYCFATESLRRIDNLNDVINKIKKVCGIDVELISGNDEALFSFEGFRASAPTIDSGIMVDMGGGSTELLKFSQSRPEQLNSFKFGCLSLRRDYVSDRFPTQEEYRLIADKVENELKNFLWIRDAKRLCLIGGTGTAIGKMATELGFTTVPEFSKETFNSLFEYLFNIDETKIALLEKHIPSRVETIIPGMCAYRKIIEIVNADTVYVSHGGIRDGFLYHKLRG